MKVIINSPCGKKVKYKIYEFNGSKRKLLRKGKFLHNIETDIKTKENQLIVRVQRYNIFIAFLKAIYVVFANIFYTPGMSHSVRNITFRLFPFDEILVKDLTRADKMEIGYKPAPMARVEYRLKQNFKVDYLTCNSHPYETEQSGKKQTNTILYVFTAIFWIALILGICLIVRFCVLHR